MTTVDRIAIPLPERHPPEADSFDWRRAAVEQWLENLPVANLGETSRRVYEAVRDVNRLSVPARARFEFLEQMRDIVDYITQGLRKQYLGHDLPLAERPRRILMLALVLLQEIATGYEIAVDDMRTGRAHQRMTRSLHRAMHYRARVLLECWLVYRAPPPGAWQRLHRLYRLAEAFDLHRARVRLRTNGAHNERTIPSAAYLQAILLAAAGPARLTGQEILDAWRVLGHWADSATLVAIDGEARTQPAIRVPRDDDAPPHASIRTLDRADDRGLDTEALKRRVEQELSRTGRPLAFWRRKPLADIHPNLLQRLMMSLDAAPVRQQPRMQAEAKIQVIVGLGRLHRHLAGERRIEEPAASDGKSRFDARDPVNTDPARADVWDLVYPRELLRELARNRPAEGEDRRERVATDSGGTDAPGDDWSLVNLSSRGYCLLCEFEGSGRARVGEVVLLRELAGRDLPWQLGAIRWMRTRRDLGLQMGVEILASSPLPVWVGGAPKGRYERALLLPDDHPDSGHASLVVPAIALEPGSRARLRQGDRETVLILGRERDTTQRYRQFEIGREPRQNAAPDA